MGWFGPSRDEVWSQLSREIGADFLPGGFWKGNRVQARVDPWIVTLDTTQSKQDGESTVTRLRAPFVNPDGLRFLIYRASAFTALGKRLGMQDIEIGDPDFDQAFVIQGNDESTICRLLKEPALRRLIDALPRFRLLIQDNEGWFGTQFPEDVDELYLEVPGVLKDLPRLRSMFELFAALLDQLCQVGSARKQDPGVTL